MQTLIVRFLQANKSISATLLTGFLLSGCGTLSKITEEKKQEPLQTPVYCPSKGKVSSDNYDTSPLTVSEIVPTNKTKFDNKLKLPQHKQSNIRQNPQVFPSELLKHIKNKDAKISNQKPEEDPTIVQDGLNYDAIDITTIIKDFAGFLGFSYMIDPAVKGTITMKAPQDMTYSEAWQMLEHMLWLTGNYATINNNVVEIKPFQKMPLEKDLLGDGAKKANVELVFFQIFNIKSGNIIQNLKPFMTPGSSITDIADSNKLLIVETPTNMLKIRKLIEELDDAGESNWPHLAHRCQYLTAQELADDLKEVLTGLNFRLIETGPSGGAIKVTAIQNHDFIIVTAALPQVLQEIEKWINILDQGNTANTESIFTYNVKSRTPEELMNVVSAFFNTTSTKSVRRTTNTKSTSSKADRNTSSRNTSSRRPTTTKGKDVDDNGEDIFETPVTIYSDESSNRLVIKTTNKVYAMIKALLIRQDIPPKQVAIKATIADITLNNSTSLGFSYAAQHKNWQLGADLSNNNSSWSATSAWPTGKNPVMGLYPSNIASLTSASSGIAAGYLKSDHMAILTAVAGRTNVKILSAPEIMVVTDEEATIDIGKRIPVKKSDYTSSSSAGSTSNQYEHENIGTKLTVTPHVTAGNEVRVTIDQVVSDILTNSFGDTKQPAFTNKKLNSTLTIPDGGTIMMGGLINTKKDRSHSGVPFLKDIPFLGQLFRTNYKNNERSELLVMITVNVIKNQSDLDKLLKQYNSALREIQEQKIK